ncbi:MAG: AMP nucleosidase, partial [Ignavibacteriae bacterium]|nr:AMP nucleosidase [Ignavibacteriota bacterium]
MKTKIEIAKNWLPRYTGTSLEEFGNYFLLTNFNNYVTKFAEQFNCNVNGIGKPMQSATNN